MEDYLSLFNNQQLNFEISIYTVKSSRGGNSKYIFENISLFEKENIGTLIANVELYRRKRLLIILLKLKI